MSEAAEAGAPWERAMAENRRRTAEADQQIADARAEPTVAELDAQRLDAQLSAAFAGVDPTPPDTVTLSGEKLAAYRKLEAAAAAAYSAQQAMSNTAVALRDAIQAMCAEITGVK